MKNFFAGQRSGLAYDFLMNSKFRQLPIDERIQLVEDLWDSIAQDQSLLPLTDEQAAVLDERLARFESDNNGGRPAAEVLSEMRKLL